MCKLTSEMRTTSLQGTTEMSQCVHYSEVPLYMIISHLSTGPLKTEVNPAYEVPCIPRSASVGQGNEPAVSPTHEYEEVPVSFREVLQTQMLSEGYLYDNDEDIVPQTNPSYIHTLQQQTC